MKRGLLSFYLCMLVPACVNAQVITTIAGNGIYSYGGDGGPATLAEVSSPFGIAIDSAGNIFIADTYNYRVRKVDASSGIITTIAGNGTAGHSGDGGPATAAELWGPEYLAIDGAGNLYMSEDDNRVRKIDASGMISTFAGDTISGFSGDGGLATAALLSIPLGITFDRTGNLYIADYNNNRVRMVNTSGIITTFAGNGTAGFSGDGAAATDAELDNPTDVTVDSAGNVYINDYHNSRIRMVNTSGIISTYAGNGTIGFYGDGGPATSAELDEPQASKMDGNGNLLIADLGNQRVREISPSGIITTIAGTGTAGYSGDGGPATNAEVSYPTDVTVDRLGNIYIDDHNNNRIREITTASALHVKLAATEQRMNIYPNPAADYITVAATATNTASGIAVVTLTDITGRTLLYKEADGSTGRNFSVTLDVRSLAAGMYFVNVKTDAGEYVRKIVKE